MLYSGYRVVGTQDADFADSQRAAREYRQQLPRLKGKLPERLFEFATAEWHYDPQDRRALHDMRVKTVVVRERQDDASALPQVAIELTLRGAYFDRELRLDYSGVKDYSFGMIKGDARIPPFGSHGDVLEDEIAVLEDGSVVHAIEFSRGAIFEILFAGPFEYSFREQTGS